MTITTEGAEVDLDQCRYCRFWSYPCDDGADTGQCRRYPPSTFLEGMRPEDNPIGNKAYWPRTRHDDWCGEHVANIVQT